MSSNWCIDSKIGREQAAWVDAGDFFFASSDWAGVLERLGASPLFAWSTGYGQGLVVPIFQRAGLKIGFMGFPVAGCSWDMVDHKELENQARSLGRGIGTDIVRVSRQFESAPGRASAILPEIWINDVEARLNLDRKRVRKDVNFARRAGADTQIISHCIDAISCHALYVEVVRSHAGSERYNLGYFQSIAELSSRSPWLRFRCAVDRSGRLLGFAVLAVHGSTCYYLHAATSEVGRRKGVSDLILLSVIEAASQLNCKRISLMASPWSQKGLIAFKRKWGDKVALAVTYDVGIGAVGRVAAEGVRLLNWKNLSLAKTCDSLVG